MRELVAKEISSQILQTEVLALLENRHCQERYRRPTLRNPHSLRLCVPSGLVRLGRMIQRSPVFCTSKGLRGFYRAVILAPERFQRRTSRPLGFAPIVVCAHKLARCARAPDRVCGLLIRSHRALKGHARIWQSVSDCEA